MATIVLVHGAWLDASAWREVIPALQREGHAVHGVQIPMTSFEGDVAATRRVLARTRGDVILVGHSYGGAVITAAAADAAQVTTLVYITALAPDAGEIFGSLLAIHPPEAHFDLIPDEYGMMWVTADEFKQGLAQDVPRSTTELLTSVQKPYAAKLFLESLPTPAWKTLRSWYLIATEDRVLSPKTQRLLAERIGATIREVPTSHLPFFAKPQAVIDIILEAAAG
jgi:pimeloyl-ACP methyl ester carboxylesterase